jgi:endogenous inhibitor of DNA gyrase (YacG/DUF329 family)
MTCPICKKPVAMGDPEMPFCSERCRLIDLGVWADEGYRIPTTQIAQGDAGAADDE